MSYIYYVRGKPSVPRVSRHFRPSTLWTQDISAPTDWCRSVSWTLRHWYQTVSTSSKHCCYNMP